MSVAYYIEPDEQGNGFWLWSWGEYEDSSVLFGQIRRVRVEHFQELKDAVAAHPGAHVQEHPTSHRANKEDMERFERSQPPAWFDPMDAGEEW